MNITMYAAWAQIEHFKLLRYNNLVLHCAIHGGIRCKIVTMSGVAERGENKAIATKHCCKTF